MSSVALSNSKPTTLKVDALVVGLVKSGDGVALARGADEVDKAFKGRLASTVSSLGARGVAGEVTRVPSLGAVSAPVVVTVGLGDASRLGEDGYDAEVLRRAAGAAARALAGTRRVGFVFEVADAARAAAVAEGALLGAYAFHQYRVAKKNEDKAPVEAFTIVTPGARDRAVKSAVDRGRSLSDAVNLARDWVNTPPSDLPPAEFAAAAMAAAKEAGLKVEVLDEKALKKSGYGGTLGVGQGSSRPPRMVKLTYTPGPAKKHLALIGKGITFDSGGLSLKPSPAMETMKSDMGGAAAVIAAATAIARQQVNVNVTVYAPMAENMPSGSAQRPSDVLRIYGGRTVEVLNTDAEGRLVLADGIARASEDKPDLMIDVATLTGAQVIALGRRTAAIMSNDDDVRDGIFDASRRAGEQMWPMPLPEELRKTMESKVADIANMGDRYGGMLVAGLFLREFVGEGLRWAHLDIAGPAYNDATPHGYTPHGGTGAAVRTLVQLAEDLADGTI